MASAEGPAEGVGVGGSNGAFQAQEEAAAGSSSPVLHDLAAIRQRHHQKYQEREEAALRETQEEKDQELAERLAKEEEEARLRQLEEDEAYSRQLAAQLNPGATEHPMQDLGPGAGQQSGADDPFDEGDPEAQYHQMEDGGDYRAPMRTGYVDRLIDPPQAALAPFLGGPGGARQPNFQRAPCGPAAMLPLACVSGLIVTLLVTVSLWGGS